MGCDESISFCQCAFALAFIFIWVQCKQIAAFRVCVHFCVLIANAMDVDMANNNVVTESDDDDDDDDINHDDSANDANRS